jgi:hypothetical protein
MAKTMILIHGRNLKPPEAALKQLWIEAVRHGIERDSGDKLAAFDAAVKEFVYFGDVSNQFLGKSNYDDSDSRQETLDTLKQYQKRQFSKTTYKKLPGASGVKEALADAFAGVTSLFRISDRIITAVAPDMREYWNPDSQFGSEVRFPMIAPLKRAMDRGDDILVVSHSLGTMIAYDTFWNFCRTGEYRPENTDKKISIWITLGSPLADETAKRNVKGARASGAWRYPENVLRWVNVAAEDDYVSHDGVVANDFAEMKKLKLTRSITDKRIYNLSVREGKSNPHHSAGYLVHPYVAEVVAGWL